MRVMTAVEESRKTRREYHVMVSSAVRAERKSWTRMDEEKLCPLRNFVARMTLEMQLC